MTVLQKRHLAELGLQITFFTSTLLERTEQSRKNGTDS